MTERRNAASRLVAEWKPARQGSLHRVDLVEGWFEEICTADTAERLRLGEVLVAMIDCDVLVHTAGAAVHRAAPPSERGGDL